MGQPAGPRAGRTRLLARRRSLGLASGNSAEFLAVYLRLRPADVRDVFVAPGTALDSTGPAYEAEPADRSWSTLAEVASTGALSTAARDVEVFVDDRDALSYLYTSGTTSFPKGVVASHAAVYLESMSAALDSQWSSSDRFAAMMPMFYTAQLNAFCTPAILVGASTYVLRGFDPAALLDLIESQQITQVFGLPKVGDSHLASRHRPGPEGADAAIRIVNVKEHPVSR